MNSEWERLVKKSELRVRTSDNERAFSLLESASKNGRVARRILIDEESATVVFREIYESFRQIGEAVWWIRGFEARTHDICIIAVQELDVQEKTRLVHLQRFKNIRNDANYRGSEISKNDALEIVECWDVCGEELMQTVKRQAGNTM